MSTAAGTEEEAEAEAGDTPTGLEAAAEGDAPTGLEAEAEAAEERPPPLKTLADLDRFAARAAFAAAKGSATPGTISPPDWTRFLRVFLSFV